MIQKDRVYIISSNVDDSIKSISIQSDITIFRTFKEFEDYIDVNPIDVATIIVNSKDLMFTNNSMNRLILVLNSSFVSLSGFLYYLVDSEEIKEKVEDVCKKNNVTKLKCVYSNTLYAKDIVDILTGEALGSKETVIELRTYRVRASDYVRSKKDKEGLDYSEIYETDEDELSGINDEPEPDDLRISTTSKAKRITVASNNIRERTAWVFIKAQYLSLSGKTLILEKDGEYHTLLDMVTKVNTSYEYFDIQDIFRDCSYIVSKIKMSPSKLIIIGSKRKVSYKYNIMLDFLIFNLKDSIDYYFYETSLSNIPYNTNVEVVTPTTVPEILRSSNEMSSISDYKNILFIGLDILNFGIVSITEKEYNLLLQNVLQENKINSVVVAINGLLLSKEIGVGGVFMYQANKVN